MFAIRTKTFIELRVSLPNGGSLERTHLWRVRLRSRHPLSSCNDNDLRHPHTFQGLHFWIQYDSTGIAAMPPPRFPKNVSVTGSSKETAFLS